MTALDLVNIEKHYPGNPTPSVKNFNLHVNPGEMVAFLGPSGCGKTTTLKMIAGLEDPTSGDILFNDESIVSTLPEKREISMVFQKPLLFPHMSVFDNVAFGLKMRKVPKDEIQSRVTKMLEFVRLGGYEKRRVTQISGGQEQRISLARGLVIDPRLLLLDEPLSALDAALRIEMRELILSIQRNLGVTSIFVTHDQEEAVMLADKIALMFDGCLQQYDVPEAFYSRPRTKRVAEFFGCNNFIKATQKGKKVESKYGTFTLEHLEERNGEVYIVVRNEGLEVSDAPGSMKGVVKSRIFMGTNVRYIVQMADEESSLFHVAADPASPFKEGDTISLSLIEESLWTVPQNEDNC